ncbi:EF-hand domain-containing protein [Pyxidicoccus parkwayensis]|uniref:EF-hand domain-containing protein n=1 Tax=Pyxidicoccus parkwayensis TaxID=2813578 RepID=A0ABX7NUY9_9BACT|nr:EF-hand domain-containing protein [Pyxidicoccus parkwaysis]QSQ22518.1 EF-hand domain-containing protein [Pyxidicoccus parkwaysis]
MNRSASHRRLLAAALCFTLPLGLVACGKDDASEEGLYVGEAAAFLTASEEGGDIGGDAVADADVTTMTSMAGEDTDTLNAEPTDDGNVCDFSARRQEVLDKYDTDGDGTLSRAEFAELRADLGERRDTVRPRLAALRQRARHWAFWRVRWAFDEDGNGKLDAAERAALVDAMEARCERLRDERLEKFDANGDGKLDATERQAARQAVLAKWREKHQALVAEYDTNGNGVLDDGERVALRQDRVAAAQQRRATLMATYDTNGDGVLSTEEALPLREAIQRRIIEGRDAAEE